MSRRPARRLRWAVGAAAAALPVAVAVGGFAHPLNVADKGKLSQIKTVLDEVSGQLEVAIEMKATMEGGLASIGAGLIPQLAALAPAGSEWLATAMLEGALHGEMPSWRTLAGNAIAYGNIPGLEGIAADVAYQMVRNGEISPMMLLSAAGIPGRFASTFAEMGLGPGAMDVMAQAISGGKIGPETILAAVDVNGRVYEGLIAAGMEPGDAERLAWSAASLAAGTPPGGVARDLVMSTAPEVLREGLRGSGLTEEQIELTVRGVSDLRYGGVTAEGVAATIVAQTALEAARRGDAAGLRELRHLANVVYTGGTFEEFAAVVRSDAVYLAHQRARDLAIAQGVAPELAAIAGDVAVRRSVDPLDDGLRIAQILGRSAGTLGFAAARTHPGWSDPAQAALASDGTRTAGAYLRARASRDHPGGAPRGRVDTAIAGSPDADTERGREDTRARIIDDVATRGRHDGRLGSGDAIPSDGADARGDPAVRRARTPEIDRALEAATDRGPEDAWHEATARIEARRALRLADPAGAREAVLDRITQVAGEAARSFNVAQIAERWPLGEAATRGQRCRGCSPATSEAVLHGAGRLGSEGSSQGGHEAASARVDALLEEVGLGGAAEGAVAARVERYLASATHCIDAGGLPDEGRAGPVAPASTMGHHTWVDRVSMPEEHAASDPGAQAAAERAAERGRARLTMEAAVGARVASWAMVRHSAHAEGVAEALGKRLGACTSLLCELRVLADAERLRLDQSRARAETAWAGLRLASAQAAGRLPMVAIREDEP